VRRKQNKGKEDSPQDWLEKREKDSIEQIEAEKSEGKDDDERNKFPFHSMFPKRSEGAVREESVWDRPRRLTEKRVISGLVAKLITTGKNSCERA